MAKYRKKPVVIEAYQWHEQGDVFNPENSTSHFDEWPKWLQAAWHKDGEEPGALYYRRCYGDDFPNKVIFILTPRGEMKVRHGDWIIQGVNGELYPCKPDVFDKTYEVVEHGD